MPAYKARRLTALNINMDEEEHAAMEGKVPPKAPEQEEGMTTL